MKHELRNDNIRITRGESTQRVSADFILGRRKKTVWFETDLGAVSDNAEPFLPVALIPAMRRGWSVYLDGAVSTQLLDGAGRIQQIFNSWYPQFNVVPVHCSGENSVPMNVPDRTGVATFFSGGIDSFYTLQSHLNEIDQLIFIHGFDIPLRQRKTNAQAAQSVRTLADKLGLKLVEVKTNLREFGQGHVSWPHAYFGAGLAAVGLLLAPRFKRIYLPASVSFEELGPLGSHPELDKYWSTTGMQLVHDGAEATRFQKVRAVSEWKPVQEHLRVCYLNDKGNANCGHCRKCLWTMMMLRAIGRLNDIRTFPEELDLEELKLYVPVTMYERKRFTEALASLSTELRDDDAVFANVLRDMLAANGRLPWKGKIKRLLTRGRVYLEHRIPFGGESG